MKLALVSLSLCLVALLAAAAAAQADRADRADRADTAVIVRVVDDDGEPCFGAQYVAFVVPDLSEPSKLQEFARLDLLRGKTDPDGEVELQRPAAGSLYVKTSDDRLASSEEWALIGKDSGTEVTLKLRTTDDLDLLGVVVDAATNEPIPGARISYLRIPHQGSFPRDEPELSTIADQKAMPAADSQFVNAGADGRFRTKAASFAPTEMWAFADGYVPERRIIIGRDAGPDGIVRVTLPMERSASVEVRAVGLTADVTIRASFRASTLGSQAAPNEIRSNYQGFQVSATSANGEVGESAPQRLLRLPPGRRVSIEARDSKDKVIWSEPSFETPAPGETSTLLIDMSPTCRIEGRALVLVDGELKPAVDQEIVLFVGGYFRQSHFGNRPMHDRAARTDENGHYQFNNLVGGTYAIGWAPGTEPTGAVACRTNVTVAAGEAPTVLDLNPTMGRYLEGRLVDRAGQPVGEDVEAYVNGVSIKASADPKTGKFSLGPVTGKTIDLRAGGMRGGVKVRGVAVAGEPITIEMPGVGHLCGWVTDGETGQRTQATVERQNPGTGVFSSGPSDGALAYFQFNDCSAVPNVVWAHGPGNRCSDAVLVSVAPGPAPTVQNLELHAASYLEIRRGPKGENVPVILKHESGWELRSGTFGTRPRRNMVPRGKLRIEEAGPLEEGEEPRVWEVEIQAGEVKALQLGD